jgi:hypothetical protein
MGKVGYGIGCGKTKPLYWEEDGNNQTTTKISNLIASRFKESHYQARVNQGNIGGAYLLKGKVKKIFVDVCVIDRKNQSSSKRYEYRLSEYVKIEWELLDSIGSRTLFQAVTEGSFEGKRFNKYKKAADGSTFEAAINIAVDNLLANKSFIKHLDSVDLNKKSMELNLSKVSLSLSKGDGKSTFNSRVDHLNKSTVTLKTSEGHGSGIIISEDGYILTNAHVVGSDEQVTALIGNRKYIANIKRKDIVRDVALLKIAKEKALTMLK